MAGVKIAPIEGSSWSRAETDMKLFIHETST